MTKLYLFLVIFLILSCQKQEYNYEWYSFAETGCANPWSRPEDRTDKALELSVEKYLNEFNVNVHSIEIAFDSSKVQFCHGCMCTTGRIIMVETNISNDSILTDIGFFKITSNHE